MRVYSSEDGKNVLKTYINTKNKVIVVIEDNDTVGSVFPFDDEEDIDSFIKDLRKFKKELYGNK